LKKSFYSILKFRGEIHQAKTLKMIILQEENTLIEELGESSPCLLNIEKQVWLRSSS
jgi:hypothetical protein